MQLSHYSNEVVTSVRPEAQAEKKHSKPKGFWVSVDGPNDWKEWCTSEYYAGFGAIRHRVILSDSARILHLKSVFDIDCFHEEYSENVDWHFMPHIKYPNWQRVASEYDGIIIAPYQWQRRFDGEASGWYYPWDCASGCIWNGNIISNIFPIIEQVAAE